MELMKLDEAKEIIRKELQKDIVWLRNNYDKNKTPIYEGDIVHIPDDWEEYGWASNENYAVDFKDGRYRLKPKYKPNANGYDLECTDELEIIGNIYDNPELVEED